MSVSGGPSEESIPSLTGSFCGELCHGGESGRTRRSREDCFLLTEGKAGTSVRVGGRPEKSSWGDCQGQALGCGVQGCRSRTRKWWVHRQRIWICPLARKQNWAFDSRGLIKGKSDIKGCFKKRFGCPGNGAEGIQSRNEKLGRPEVLGCGPDGWGGQGQNTQWEAELLFSYFKGKMFTGCSKKGEIRFHHLCDIS